MTFDPSPDALALGAGTYTGISVPGDSIFDNIFDWIFHSVSSVYEVVTDYIYKFWTDITSTVGKLVSYAVTTITGWTSTLYDWAVNAVDWIRAVYDSVTSWVGSAWNTIYGAASLAVAAVDDWIINSAGVVSSWVTTEVNRITSNISGFFSNLWTNIQSHVSGAASLVDAWVSACVNDLKTVVTGIPTTITNFITAKWAELTSTFDWLTTWMSDNIIKPLATWWDTFLKNVFDFTTWVPKLFDAVSTWFSRDIPGQSPFWHTLILGPLGFLWDVIHSNAQAAGRSDWQQTIWGLSTSLEWVGARFGSIIDGMISAVLGYFSNVGPISPEQGLVQAQSIGKVAMAALGGLVGLSLTGELVGFWKHIGLGNISAIFYDMSNYKLITAGLMGALVAASVSTPLRYYFAAKLRPNLPSIRELSDMWTEESLTRAEFGQYLAYHGIPDVWHDKYADIAFRAMSPYQLKNAAMDGSFDEGIFSRELTHAGFRPEVKVMLLDSFKKAAMTQVKTYNVASATGRFKNGWTDESQFTSELKLLQVGDDNIPMYVVMTKLDYMTSYLTDLETAYVDAVRSGQLTLEAFRQSLLNLGMVPERVEGKVMIEQLRVKPSASPSVIAGPKATYITDAGKLQVDTLRRQRRLGMITGDEEQAGLIYLGMPTDLASAYTANDDVLTAESSIPPAGALVPKYETTAGKLQVDTIRRQRRAGTLSHDQETAQLGALSMPADLAESYASNDDLRLKASATASGG